MSRWKALGKEGEEKQMGCDRLKKARKEEFGKPPKSPILPPLENGSIRSMTLIPVSSISVSVF